jgi:hypothetical protein
MALVAIHCSDFCGRLHTALREDAGRAGKPFIRPQDQLVFYDVYLNGLPFYLRVQRPIWVIWSGQSKIIMQNIYVAQKQPAPVPGYGPVLFTYKEFAKEWNEANSRCWSF